MYVYTYISCICVHFKKTLNDSACAGRREADRDHPYLVHKKLPPPPRTTHRTLGIVLL